MPTKKQIKAMQDIIADLQSRKDESINALNAERAKEDEPLLPRKLFGEQKTPTGYMVLDGYVGVYYHKPVADLPHADEYELTEDMLRREIEDQFENGDYYLVCTPFDGTVRSSKIRELVKAHGQSIKMDHGRMFIDLQAKTEREAIICGRFNALYVIRAVEALGGTVRLYIGKHRVRSQPYPFLIVVSDDSTFNLDRDNCAIVMPMRK